MFLKQKSTLPLVVLSAALSIILSYLFGNDGYEAFVVACIGLGILTIRQTIELIRIRQSWLIVQILVGLALTIIGSVVLVLLFFALYPKAANPNSVVPPINWMIVLISAIPFFLRPIANSKQHDLEKILTSAISLPYAAMTFYAAAAVYYRAESSSVSLILVLAVQLQYLMAFILTRTKYIQALNDYYKQKNIYGNSGGIILVTVGLPYFLPLAVVIYSSTIK